MKFKPVAIDRKELDNLAAEGRLFAVFDTCGARPILNRIFDLPPEQAISLFQGEIAQQYWGFAPYLAGLDLTLLEWVMQDLCGQPWGIFVISNESYDAVYAHLRRFLHVRTPAGEQWFSRFYDPRVLRSSVELLSDGNIRRFLGPPVVAYGCSTARSGSAEIFTRDLPSLRRMIADATTRP